MAAPCICKRQARGHGWFKPRTPIGQRVYYWFCSGDHREAWLRITNKGKRAMPDLTADEITAVIYAAEQAGEYIESLGRTDMATWSEEEWMEFISLVFQASTWKLGEIIGEKEIPF